MGLKGESMKKVIIGVLLLIGIAAVGAPFVNGLMMEKMVKQSLGNLNTMYSDMGSGVSAEILRYDRNFFSTEIEWKINLGAYSSVYGVNDIVLVERAKHGMTGIVSKTSLEKNKWFTDFVNNKLAGKNPLDISTEYNLSGQITSSVVLDAFSLPVKDGGVQVKAGKSTFTCNKELTNFSSEMSWGGISASNKLNVEGITFSSDLKRLSTYLWDGVFSFGIDKGEITENLEKIELNNAKVEYSLDVDDDEKTISVVTTIGADHLLAGSEQVDNGFVRLGLVNMDVQGFEEFMKVYSELANTIVKEIPAVEENPENMTSILEEKVEKTQYQIMAAYEKLLKKGLEFQISELHAQLPEGEITGDVVLSLNKDMTFTDFFPVLQQPELMLDIFSLQSELNLPAKLVGGNTMLLSPMYKGMPTGLFVQNGDKLSHKAETKDHKLYLNGQVVVF